MNPPDDPFADAKFVEFSPPPELGRQISSDCTRGLTPARGLSRGVRWSITLATAAGVSGALLAVGLEASTHTENTLSVALAWGAGIALLSVFMLLRPPGRRPSTAMSLTIVVSSVVLFLLFVGMLIENTSSLLSALGTQATWKCGSYSLFTGAVTALFLMLPWRRTDPLSPNLTGAFLGLCAGLAAGLAATMVCPNHEAWHLLLGHGLMLAITVALAARFGRRWLAP